MCVICGAPSCKVEFPPRMQPGRAIILSQTPDGYRWPIGSPASDDDASGLALEASPGFENPWAA